MSHIALCGVFDIPNYGDHLFPLVCRNELKQRGYAGNVELFSPFEAQESFVENSIVHSLDDLERMHREEPFDAIIVGGGEIIHWHRFGQKRNFSSEAFTPYPMDKVWIIPSLMRMKYDVPLLWNAPGIPFGFDTTPELAHLLIANTDYISVRNDFSAKVLSNIGINQDRIAQVPDTGFSLRSIAASDQLCSAKDSVFPNLDNYIVFHCNRFIPKDAIPYVVLMLTELHDMGYRVVLLPLAYTHGDEEALRNISEKLPFDALLPSKPLSLLQIIGILANCCLYVGTSLHGTVTASVFGNPVVSFDYQKTKKTKDLYHQLNFDEYYVTDAEKLDTVVKQAMTQQHSFDFYDIQMRINKHFDALYAYLDGTRKVKSDSTQVLVELADMTQSYFECQDQCKGLLKRQKELEEALQTNIDFTTIFKSRAESYANDVNNLKHEIQEKQRQYDELSQKNDQLIQQINKHPIKTYRNIRKTSK